METLQDTADAPAAAAPKGAARFARVPADVIGRLLDHGTAGAYAVHLIALKRLHGSGWTINERQVAKPTAEGGIAMGERKLRKALTLARRQKVLERCKGGRRPDGKSAFARERLVPGRDRYVDLPETLVRSCNSKMVGFVAATLLSPFPQDARDIAKRIGVSTKSPNTIKRLVEAAVVAQHVAAEHVGRHWIVARPGVNLASFKNVAIQNVAVQNVAIHSRQEDEHSSQEERAQETGKPLQEATRSDERGSPRREDFSKELGPEWIVLKDWRSSAFWRERGYFDFTGQVKTEDWSLDRWRWCLDHYGGAPAHVATDKAHTQALEIAHELSAILGINAPGRALHALGFWICRAHAGGKTIRSLAFIAEELARRCYEGDETWVYDLPYRIPQAQVDQALKLARQAAPMLEAANINMNRQVLFSTVEIETLARTIERHCWSGVAGGINHALRAGRKPAEGHRICGWSWFDEDIAVAQKATEAAARRAADPWAQQRAAAPAREAVVRKAAGAAVAQLAAAGIEVDGRRLLLPSQIRDLACRFGREIPASQVLPLAVARWLRAPTRPKIAAWSNLGEAIRAEVAEW